MKVGVALGGGGVRGFAHVLALQTIDACGIVPEALAGTSMGAIIGALYASGRKGTEIRAFVENHVVEEDDKLEDLFKKRDRLIKWLSALKPAWDGSGLLKADGFLHYLLDEIHAERFEDLEIPLRVVATDFHRGEPVVFDSGELLPAILASMSIPGIYVPVEHEGRVLVDGGLVDNLPYDLLDDCDVTVAVDVAPTRDPDETEPPNMIDATIGMFDIFVDRAVERMRQERPPTIYLRPRLTGIRTLDFEKAETVFEQARPTMEELREALERMDK